MEGLKALGEGRYKEALDLCTRAESLMHAPTHLLLIARVQTKLGHLVEAQEAYIKVQRDQLAPDAPRAFVEAQRTASDEEAEIAPLVPSLKVTIEGATLEDAKVTLDGAVLAPALIGLAWPIDPGTYTLAAKSPGAEAPPVTVTIVEGARQAVLLSLKPVVTAAPEPLGPAAPADATPSSGGHAGLRAGGWIGLAVGVTGIVVGSIFVAKNHSDRGDANALCDGNRCPSSNKTAVDSFDSSANTDETIAWVGYGVGAVGVLAGAALLWSSGKRAGPQTGQVSPWVGPRSAGLTVAF
jgi:hypothetical protein